ncbi:MAG: hypothetical protein ABJO97_18775 [Roseibium sp.]|uniref:hypothetical protein n=1 Tax=Alphaproteobacteria TaxID=28211 RepID=UPI00329A2D73
MTDAWSPVSGLFLDNETPFDDAKVAELQKEFGASDAVDAHILRTRLNDSAAVYEWHKANAEKPNRNEVRKQIRKFQKALLRLKQCYAAMGEESLSFFWKADFLAFPPSFDPSWKSSFGHTMEVIGDKPHEVGMVLQRPHHEQSLIILENYADHALSLLKPIPGGRPKNQAIDNLIGNLANIWEEFFQQKFTRLNQARNPVSKSAQYVTRCLDVIDPKFIQYHPIDESMKRVRKKRTSKIAGEKPSQVLT